MNRVSVVMVALALALPQPARADDLPAPHARAKPFLTGNEDNTLTVVGAFGPAKDTMMVFTFIAMEANGRFGGFALIPDDKAKNGQRKIALPKLPQGSESGEMAATLVANLDKDADDELVVGFRVFRTVRGGPGGGYSYSTWEYAVVDWDGKKFVRLPALEKKLLNKAESREEHKTSVLSEADARAALGVAKR